MKKMIYILFCFFVISAIKITYAEIAVWPEQVSEELTENENFITQLWIGNRTESEANINWQATETPPVDWLQLSHLIGSDLEPGEANRIILQIDAPITEGIYETTIEISWIDTLGNSGTFQVPIITDVFDPELQFNPPFISFIFEEGHYTDTTWVHLTNNGTGPLKFNLIPYSQPFPFPDDRNEHSRSSRYPGDIIYQWESDLPNPYGVAYQPGFVWIGSTFYGQRRAKQFFANDTGDSTGNSINFNFSSTTNNTDMAYDQNHNGIWVTGFQNGNNSIGLIHTETNELLAEVTGDWSASGPTGIAYNPYSDQLWVGGPYHDVIYCVKGIDWDNPGETIRTIPHPGDISGIAYDCAHQTLWVTTRHCPPGHIYELDTYSGNALTSIEYPGYSSMNNGGGCEMDEYGNLWVINAYDDNIYCIETTGGGGCYDTWLAVVPPNSGKLNPGETDSIAIAVDMSKVYSSTYFGQIDIFHNDYDADYPTEIAIMAIAPPDSALGDGGPNSINISIVQEGEPQTEQIWITNKENANSLMDWYITMEPEINWLTLSPESGQGLIPGDTTFIDVIFHPDGLETELYQTTLKIHWWGTLEGNEGIINHEINLIIFNPDIRIDSQFLQLSGTIGDTIIDTIRIYNDGDGPLIWEGSTYQEPQLLNNNEQRWANILIWNPCTDTISAVTGEFFYQWLSERNYQVEYYQGDILEMEISQYDMLFACTGIQREGGYWLNYLQRSHLLSYLELGEGRAMYLEGASLWYNQDILLQHFSLTCDGYSDVDPVSIHGVTGSIFEGLNFDYSGPNEATNQFEATPPAWNALDATYGAYCCGVAYENSDYKTFASSVLFGALDNPDLLMGKMMEWFSINKWLKIQPEIGTVMPGDENQQDLQISIDASSMWTESYEGDVIIQSNDPEMPSLSIPISVDIETENVQGKVWPDSIITDIIVGESYTTYFHIGNATEAQAYLHWELFLQPEVDWLTLSQIHGENLSPNSYDQILITKNAADYTIGTYETSLITHWWGESGDEGNIEVPLIMNVVNPEIELEPDHFNFFLADGIQSDSLIISNIGTGNLVCTIKTAYLHNDTIPSQSKRYKTTFNSRQSKKSKQVKSLASPNISRDVLPTTPSHQPLEAGDIIYQWDTHLTSPSGLGYIPGYVWITEPYSNMARQYTADEFAHLNHGVLLDFGTSRYGDMAYDTNHNGMWVICIGGNPYYDRLTLFDMETGELLAFIEGDWAHNSPRGLTYDPESDHLIVSTGYYGIYIAKGLSWDNPGETVRHIIPSHYVSGVAYSCAEQNLWITSPGVVDTIYELDYHTGETITSIPFPESGEEGLTRCKMDNDGNLWLLNSNNDNAYLIETNADGGCHYDYNWLATEPKGISIPEGEDRSIIITVDSTGLEDNAYEGFLQISHNDPDTENPIEVPVHFYRQYPGFNLSLNQNEIFMGTYYYTSHDHWQGTSVTLRNYGTDAGNWNGTWSQDWLEVSPNSGWLEALEVSQLSIVANTGNLPLGTYADTLIIDGENNTNGPQELLIWFEIVEENPLAPQLFGQWEPYSDAVHLWWEYENGIPETVLRHQVFRRLNDEPYSPVPYWVITNANTLYFWDADIPPCDSLHYKVKSVLAGGLPPFSNEITLMGFTGIEKNYITGLPTKFSLSQNYPNPFNPDTEIFYAIPENCYVTLEIYTINGQLVRSLINQKQNVNFYSAKWDGKDHTGKNMPGGMYVYTLTAGDYSQSKRMILLK